MIYQKRVFALDNVFLARFKVSYELIALSVPFFINF